MGCQAEGLEKKNLLSLEYLLAQQNSDGMFSYNKYQNLNNLTTSVWCTMALVSHILAEIGRDNPISEKAQKLRISMREFLLRL